MQIFLPQPDHEWSARCVDSQRLSKQITESYQLQKSVLRLSRGYPNHPARWMYYRHMESFMDYMRHCRDVHVERGGSMNHHAYLKAVFTHRYWLWMLNRGERPVMEGPLQGMRLGTDFGIDSEWEPAEGDELRLEGEPWFIGHPAFHLSHQWNLARKRPDQYSEVFDLHVQEPHHFKREGIVLDIPWGNPDLPLVQAEEQPYLWPLTTPEGVHYFQVGVKAGKKTITMTPDEALADVEVRHPVYLQRFYERAESYSANPGPEQQRLRALKGLMDRRLALWPGSEPSELDPGQAEDFEESEAAFE